MTPCNTPSPAGPRALVVGAGIAGLAGAARLAAAGYDVTVLERHSAPGGRMRSLPSVTGPVDAGPTVLTMRPVFEALFRDLGTRLEDHVTLIRQPLLARHFWPDGSRLDLFDDAQTNSAAIADFAGTRAAGQFRRFSDRARRLFEAFDTPMMQAATPSLAGMTRHVLARPTLIPAMAPLSSLARSLARQFDDARLAQLFGRYATYVGGSPYRTPALLALIWQAEAAGVWVVEGGMHRLAQAVEGLARSHGARFHYGAHVTEITVENSRATGARLADGTRYRADVVLFNGDPRALATGQLGTAVETVAPQTRRAPRSLSAEVWAFAATPTGPELAHHNVFFRDAPKPEFDAIAGGRSVADPTLYLCAQDRGTPGGTPAPERFEIIANAAPLTQAPTETEFETCRTRTFQTLARFGLTFDPPPDAQALTTPRGFEQLFPATAGSLYGQSPQGLTGALSRPTARTPVAGLYLAGGGTHPGAGVPMATLSARHAAEAIVQDRCSTSPSRPTAMPGGISTGSATIAGDP
ncbi:MAG: phytoene desaturase family protein [Salibaculum sp.]|uniref:1-hydroxycarotenoid 3,4-desaturase CrtD n=1 Tax=Salibaculum sp. TaxID=2855480 RepID=UPI00286FE450|nr:1-hydroxycarotenoid 3,4-desaturase CrtD [Salibaculum sp.]MDR9426566.1 phytoene desaturase family protein [Salibaculum sp.]MDR9481227.1 phytoene desaturase family protein [Salibaculum sp.]